MQTELQAIRVSEHVYWVGAIDREIRDFHGYSTPRGTTYNAYLVLGSEPILIDTVKAPFLEEMLARIRSVIDPRTIRQIISNHSELDHSGCLPQMIRLCKPEWVFASGMGAKALAEHHLVDGGITPVKDGETVTLGGLQFSFTETRMLHWPDSMFTYLADDSVLFSQDAFGMHYASDARWEDELPREAVEYEAAKYFANILLPFAPRVAKLLSKLQSTDLPGAVIAPDHGPVWRQDQSWIFDAYARWAAREAQNKAVIVYDTMWESTAKMAATVAGGLREGGSEAKLMPLRTSHRSDVATELLEAGALLVGTPTLNDQMFPTVADVLTYLKGLKPQGLVGAVFGSYGWSASGLDDAKAMLESMKVELISEPLKAKYVPDAAALSACRELGLRISERLHQAAAMARA